MTAAAIGGPSTRWREGVARLLVWCTDQPDLVAALTSFLRDRGASLHTAQHSTDPEDGTFAMRLEFKLDERQTERAAIEQAFADEVAGRFGMEWRLSYAAHRKRVAVLVSRYDHCLAELLWRWRRAAQRRRSQPYPVGCYGDVRVFTTGAFDRSATPPRADTVPPAGSQAAWRRSRGKRMRIRVPPP